MIDTTKLHKIETEKEYHEQYAIYIKRLDDIKELSPFYVVKNIKTYTENFFNLMDEMEYIGLFDSDYINQQKLKMLNALNLPQEVKKWGKEKAKMILEKIKSKKIKTSEII